MGRGHEPPRVGTPLGASEGTSSRNRGHRLRSSPHDEGRRAVIMHPPQLRFSLLDMLTEFVVWLASPVDTSLRLPHFFSSEIPSSGLDGLWLQVDGC